MTDLVNYSLDLSQARHEFSLLTAEVEKTIAAVRRLKLELDSDSADDPPEGA